MTTIHVSYACDGCKNQFNATMKAGEPLVSRTCPKCGGTANASIEIV